MSVLVTNAAKFLGQGVNKDHSELGGNVVARSIAYSDRGKSLSEAKSASLSEVRYEPWCGNFLAYIIGLSANIEKCSKLSKYGIKSPAGAKNWESVGTAITYSEVLPGDILIVDRDGGSGRHVCIVAQKITGGVRTIDGNWGGQVKYQNRVTSGELLGNPKYRRLPQELLSLLGEVASYPPSLENALKTTTVSDSKSTNATQNIGASIGYGFDLGQFNNNPESQQYIKTLLEFAKISDTEVFYSGLGLTGKDAEKFVEKNSNYLLVNDQIESIFTFMLNEYVKRIQVLFSVDLKQYPKEINTALCSYVYGRNLSNSTFVTKKVKPVIEFLKNKDYKSLASFIESSSDSASDKEKLRRRNEANLIRSMKEQTNNSEYQELFTSDGLGVDSIVNKGPSVSSARDRLRTLRELYKNNNRNQAATDSVNGFENEINRSVTDNVGDMMQLQQKLVDTYFMEDESEYVFRLNVKNRFSKTIRDNSISLSDAIVKLENEDPDNKYNRIDLTYKMIPSGKEATTVSKKNAIARCEYRIKNSSKKLEEIYNTLAKEFGISSSVGNNINDIINNTHVKKITVASTPEKNSIKIKRLITLLEEMISLRNEYDMDTNKLRKLKVDYSRFTK